MWGNPGGVSVLSAFQERGPFPDDQGLPHLSVSALPPPPSTLPQTPRTFLRPSGRHQVTPTPFLGRRDVCGGCYPSRDFQILKGELGREKCVPQRGKKKKRGSGVCRSWGDY